VNPRDSKAFVIARGDKTILRDRLPSDVDSFIRWQTHGEWREYDAPWESMRTTLTEEDQGQIRAKYLAECAQDQPWPRKRAIVATLENEPLGWVNRYADKRFPDAWLVGINICEDAYLNRGIGTEALGLWIDYLFSNSGVHRIGLDTWSLNPRMVRVAEELGFVYEGTERELIEWQGEWLDRVHFGMLRREWVEKRQQRI